MKKAILFLAFVLSVGALFGQALPSGSVPYGTQLWIAPDGGIWTGTDNNGFKQLLVISNTAFAQSVESTVIFENGGSLRVPTPTTDGMAANKGYVDGAIAGAGDLTIQDVTDNGHVTDNTIIVTGSNGAFSQSGLNFYYSPSVSGGGMAIIDGTITKVAGWSEVGDFFIGYGDETPGQNSPRFTVYNTGLLTAEFSGRVSGADAVNTDEFVTLSQLSDSVKLSSSTLATTFTDIVAPDGNTLLWEADIPANTMSSNGDRLEMVFNANFTGNGVIDIDIDDIQIYSQGSGVADGVVQLEITLVRVTQTTARAIIHFSGTADIGEKVISDITSLNFSAAQTIEFRGSSGSAGNLTLKYGAVDLHPAP